LENNIFEYIEACTLDESDNVNNFLCHKSITI